VDIHVEAQARELLVFRAKNGNAPFLEWLRKLKDRDARARIRTRLDRVESGNLGVHKGVGDGVLELICDFGPGYRVYFGLKDDKVILLTGGNKNTQSADIEEAKKYWSEYNARQEDE
jgi:putative addiction module killer protein